MGNMNKKDQLTFIKELSSENRSLGSAGSILKSQLIDTVKRDLCPSHKMVALRLIGVHLVSSLLTLSICPQFGIRIIGQGHGLMAYFMPFGMLGCFLLCGAFYLGVTVLLSQIILSRPDWRQIKSFYTFYMLGLSLSSLLVFKFIHGEFLLMLSVAWLLGAMASAYLGLLLPQKIIKLVKL